jgi:hypothetical protein
MSGGYVLQAMATAHELTADQLETERKALEARLCENETGVEYNPKGKRK